MKSFDDIVTLFDYTDDEGNFNNVVYLVESYLDTNPDDSLKLELTKIKIDFYTRNFEYSKAEKLIPTLLESSSNYFKNVGYVRKAIFLLNTGNTKFSFEYFLRAYNFAKVKNDKKEMAIILNGLGNLYSMNSNDDKAISYYLNAYNQLPDENYIHEKNLILNNLTSAYNSIGKIEISKYYLDLHRKLMSKVPENEIIKFTYYFNSTNFYVDENITLAEKSLINLKKTSFNFKNNYRIGLYYSTKSHLEFKKNQFLNALNSIDSAYFYLKKGSSDLYLLNTYKAKLIILKKLNRHKEAFDVLDEYDKLKKKTDIFFVDAYVQEAELKYNDINQKLTLTKLKLKNEKQEKLKENFIYAFILFTIIILFATYLILQYSKKINIQKKIINSKIQTNTFLTILKTEERERQRISQELHDIIGAKMAVLRMMIENVYSSQNNNEQYLKTTNYIDKIIDEMRQISHNLLPQNIKKIGLDNAISELVSNINNETKIHVDYFSKGIDDKIDEYSALFIYRIVQEFAGNMIKHSKATECILNVYKVKNQIHITIEDNGIGFQISNDNKGQGIREIQDFINKVNGTFEIESSSSNGTNINIIFNLTNTTNFIW